MSTRRWRVTAPSVMIRRTNHSDLHGPKGGATPWVTEIHYQGTVLAEDDCHPADIERLSQTTGARAWTLPEVIQRIGSEAEARQLARTGQLWDRLGGRMAEVPVIEPVPEPV